MSNRGRFSQRWRVVGIVTSACALLALAYEPGSPQVTLDLSDWKWGMAEMAYPGRYGTTVKESLRWIGPFRIHRVAWELDTRPAARPTESP